MMETRTKWRIRQSILPLLATICSMSSIHAFAFTARRNVAVTVVRSSPTRLHSLNDIQEENAPDELDELGIATLANELASQSPPVDANGNPTSINLPDEISNSFLQYALSIILGRALPDARDGLKPVHRRILYAMSGLSLTPSSSHRKCARVVGEVLGKYHPHGDVAVYDALVRLAQTFSTGTPLVDGHGNFGSVDADPAAAMRYTECRLTKVSHEALLADLGSDAVDYVDNFDGNEVEPCVLPAKLPVLLLNGGAGIAVGMATNIPPHNLGELMDACTALLVGREEGKVLDDEELLSLVPAPDFPTGAMIMGQEAAKELYKTGHGGITVRSITNIETIKKVNKKSTDRTAIVVTELPYQVNKSALLEKIANLVNEKKIDGISDLRDESDRDGIRIVIELKRDAIPAVVENNLFKKTNLQTTFSGNFLALMGDNGTKPQRFTLRSSLDHFLDFRFLTIRRRSKHDLGKVSLRAHIVDGLLAALTVIDEVIELVRMAPDQSSARAALMDTSNEQLSLSKEQADAVLKLQLGQLTRLNKDKLLDEKSSLEESISEFETLLKVDSAVHNLMISEFKEMKQKFGIPRRTRIENEEGSGELDDMDLIENAQSVIVVTRGGYIKRMALTSFESQGRGTRGKKGTSNTQQDDNVAQCFTCNDHDKLLFITRRGIAYGIRAFQIPVAGRTARGVPIPSVLPVKSTDTVSSILPVQKFSDDEFCVLATKLGWIKKTPLSAFENTSSRGLTIATLDVGDELNWCQKCTDDDDILVGSSMGKATRFHAKDLRPTGRTSRGVKSMSFGEDDQLSDMSILKPDSSSEKKDEEYYLAMTASGYGKRIHPSEFSPRARGGKGVMAIKFKKANVDDYVTCLRVVKDNDEILLVTKKGIIVRQKVKDIPSQGRAATGVRVQKVDFENGDVISNVSIVPSSP